MVKKENPDLHSSRVKSKTTGCHLEEIVLLVILKICWFVFSVVQTLQ